MNLWAVYDGQGGLMLAAPETEVSGEAGDCLFWRLSSRDRLKLGPADDELEVCEECKGEGNVVCLECDGRGCGECEREGVVTCGECEGLGMWPRPYEPWKPIEVAPVRLEGVPEDLAATLCAAYWETGYMADRLRAAWWTEPYRRAER